MKNWRLWLHYVPFGINRRKQHKTNFVLLSAGFRSEIVEVPSAVLLHKLRVVSSCYSERRHEQTLYTDLIRYTYQK